MHGAAGVILINDRPTHPNDPDSLVKFSGEEGPSDAGIPFVQVKEADIDPLVRRCRKEPDRP